MMSDKSHQFSPATREGFVMKSYKYKLKPSAKIIAIFEAWLAICCELYNAAVQERRDAYRIACKSVGFVEQCAELPEVKAERQDVARVHSQVLQNVLRGVALAFDNFFRRVKECHKPGYPRFRSKARISIFQRSARSRFTCHARSRERLRPAPSSAKPTAGTRSSRLKSRRRRSRLRRERVLGLMSGLKVSLRSRTMRPRRSRILNISGAPRAI